MTFYEACLAFEVEMAAERAKYGLKPGQPWTQEIVNRYRLAQVKS
jgi:hypothetical protein